MASNPYTFGDLQAELNQSLFPTGLPVNLVVPVRLMYVEALLTCQKFVDCLQINNTQIVPQCNTLFKCGYTVFDAPRGHINRIYSIDQINQNTGLEDPTVALDWCSVVEYRQAAYEDLDRYVSTTLAGSLGEGFWPWLIGFGLQGVVAFPSTCLQFWNSKYAYPPPDDTPFAKSPPLPIGFHYPQSATDNPAGRSQWGLWALKGGQIYVAPWIQSTETLVVEWNGLNRSIQDTDLVDNDPMLKQAIEAYVSKEYARKYDKDYDAEAAETARFNEALAILMDECRKETEIREAGEGAAARGAALVVPTFVNDAQTATATCPPGSTGDAVSYTQPQGTVVSTVSVADANARAKSMALQVAGGTLNCTVIPPTFLNTPQSFTANCSGTGTGSPVTVNIAAGQFTSIVSQEDANAQALAAATSQANAQLVCTFSNALFTLQGSCNDGSHPTTITIPAGTYTGSTQAIADLLAQNAANTQLQAYIVANCGADLFQSTPQTVSVGGFCSVTGASNTGNWTTGGTWTLPAGAATGTSQLAANNTANLLAQSYGNNMLTNLCAALKLGGTPLLIQNYVQSHMAGSPGNGTYEATMGNSQFGGVA